MFGEFGKGLFNTLVVWEVLQYQGKFFVQSGLSNQICPSRACLASTTDCGFLNISRLSQGLMCPICSARTKHCYLQMMIFFWHHHKRTSSMNISKTEVAAINISTSKFEAMAKKEMLPSGDVKDFVNCEGVVVL